MEFTEGTQSTSSPKSEQARHVAEVARERAVREADKRLDTVGEKLGHFASKLEHAFDEEGSSTERQVAQRAAGLVRQVSNRIEGKSTEQLLSEAREQFRHRPGLMTAGLVAIGFIGGRLLKG